MYTDYRDTAMYQRKMYGGVRANDEKKKVVIPLGIVLFVFVLWMVYVL